MKDRITSAFEDMGGSGPRAQNGGRNSGGSALERASGILGKLGGSPQQDESDGPSASERIGGFLKDIGGRPQQDSSERRSGGDGLNIGKGIRDTLDRMKPDPEAARRRTQIHLDKEDIKNENRRRRHEQGKHHSRRGQVADEFTDGAIDLVKKAGRAFGSAAAGLGKVVRDSYEDRRNRRNMAEETAYEEGRETGVAGWEIVPDDGRKRIDRGAQQRLEDRQARIGGENTNEEDADDENFIDAEYREV